MKRPSTSIAAATSPPADARLAVLLEGLRYLVVSAAALAVDFGLLMGLTRYAGVGYAIAAVLGFSAGLAVAYVGSVRWAFNARACVNHQAELVIFASIGIAGLLVNEGVLIACVAGLALPVALAKLFSAGFVFTCNFVLRKKFLFTPGDR